VIGQGEQPTPVPGFALTGGRTIPSRQIELNTLLLLARSAPELAPTASRQQRGLLRLCRGGVLSAAEASAHLGLPFSVITILVSELADSGHLEVQTHTAPADLALLEEVLDGLRNL